MPDYYYLKFFVLPFQARTSNSAHARSEYRVAAGSYTFSFWLGSRLGLGSLAKFQNFASLTSFKCESDPSRLRWLTNGWFDFCFTWQRRYFFSFFFFLLPSNQVFHVYNVRGKYCGSKISKSLNESWEWRTQSCVLIYKLNFINFPPLKLANRSLGSILFEFIATVVEANENEGALDTVNCNAFEPTLFYSYVALISLSLLYLISQRRRECGFTWCMFMSRHPQRLEFRFLLNTRFKKHRLTIEKSR